MPLYWLQNIQFFDIYMIIFENQFMKFKGDNWAIWQFSVISRNRLSWCSKIPLNNRSSRILDIGYSLEDSTKNI